MGSNKPNWRMMQEAAVVQCEWCSSIFSVEDATWDTEIVELGDCPFCAGPLVPAREDWDPTIQLKSPWPETVTILHMQGGILGGYRTLAVCTIEYESDKKWLTHVYPCVIYMGDHMDRGWEPTDTVLVIDRENPLVRRYSTSWQAAMALHAVVPEEALRAASSEQPEQPIEINTSEEE